MLEGESNAAGTSNIDQFPCGSFLTPGPEVWYSFAPAVDVTIKFSISPTEADLDLFEVGGDDLGLCDPEEACLAASQGAAEEGLTVGAVGGETIWIAVDGYNGATGAFSLTPQCWEPRYRWVAVRSRTGDP